MTGMTGMTGEIDVEGAAARAGTGGCAADVEPCMTVNTSTSLHLDSLATGVSRRRLLVGLVVAPVMASLLAACGDPTVEPAGTDDTSPEPTGSTPATNPGTTPGSDAGPIAHITDADVAVIRWGAEGGFVPADTYFVNLPSLVVSGDGQVYVPGAVAAIYPGPLVMPMGVRSMSEAGIQRLLSLASAAGLLATPPDYTAEMMVADAPDTVVRLTTADGTFEHRAYALGFGIDDQGAPAPEATPARQALLDFVLAIGDLPGTVGAAELGEETILEPAEYRFRATPVTEADLTGLDPAPRIVEWPADNGIDLTAAAECAQVSAKVVGDLFTSADQLTFFRQGDVIHRLAVAPVLPGDAVC